MNSNNRDNERKTGADPLRRNAVEGVASKSGLPPFSFDPSLRELFDGACDDTLTDEQFDRLETALASSADARREYLRYFTLNGEMRYLVSMGQADQAARDRTGAWGSTETCFAEPPPAELLNNSLDIPSPVGFFQGMAENFAPDWARAYLLAAAVLGLFLLAASIIQVSRHTATNLPIQSAENTPGETELDYVARVTGMKDCDWIDPESEPFAGAMIPPGREFALSAGLLEITYASGARVILEGPCTYTVASSIGGYLERGKLVARVEKRREKREERRERSGGLAASAASAKPQATNPQSLASSPQPPAPPLSTLHSPLFTISTPTAVVTDLGTEFGVEVNEQGDTSTYVFRGVVKVQVASFSGDRRGEGDGSVILRTDESARVEIDKTAVARLLTDVMIGDPSKFVRLMPRLPRANHSALAKDSADFMWKYEMDVDPAAQDLDANPGPDWRRHRGAVRINGDGTATLDYAEDGSGCFISAGVGDSAHLPGHVWNSITPETGYTIELRIKVAGTVAWHGHELGLYFLATDSATERSSIVVITNKSTLWDIFSKYLIDNNRNDDDFHVFRIAQEPNSGEYRVWRDGVLVRLSEGFQDTGWNRLQFGDMGAGGGPVVVDYVRVTPGAYAPPSKRTIPHSSSVQDKNRKEEPPRKQINGQ